MMLETKTGGNQDRNERSHLGNDCRCTLTVSSPLTRLLLELAGTCRSMNFEPTTAATNGGSRSPYTGRRARPTSQRAGTPRHSAGVRDVTSSNRRRRTPLLEGAALLISPAIRSRVKKLHVE